MTLNRSSTSRTTLASLSAGVVLGLTNSALATEFSGGAWGFSAYETPGGAVSMRVTGPKGFAVETDSFSYSADEALPDGTYKYEITGAVAKSTSKVDVKKKMDQGRSLSARSGSATGVIDSGHFRIKRGEVVVPDSEMVEKKSNSNQ